MSLVEQIGKRYMAVPDTSVPEEIIIQRTTVGKTAYTIKKNGYIRGYTSKNTSGWSSAIILVDGRSIWRGIVGGTGSANFCYMAWIPVEKGAVIELDVATNAPQDASVIFIPAKLAPMG